MLPVIVPGRIARQHSRTLLIDEYPEFEGGLYARFKLAVERKEINPRPGWWADSLPLESNDAVFDEAQFSQSKVIEFHRFVELILKEFFTLPSILSDPTSPTRALSD